MKEYKYYGHDVHIDIDNKEYSHINNIQELYNALEKCWSIETCAPRLRREWSEENKTRGQCSITAFLVQDIMGGEVYGVPLSDGNYHCFNIVNGQKFDLTSEQFQDVTLDYEHVKEQSREVHFAKEEKYQRYLLLKEKLKKLAICQ